MSDKRAQSFVEYLILVAVIVAVSVFLAGGPFHGAVDRVLQTTDDGAKVIADSVNNAAGSSNGNATSTTGTSGGGATPGN